MGVPKLTPLQYLSLIDKFFIRRIIAFAVIVSRLNPTIQLVFFQEVAFCPSTFLTMMIHESVLEMMIVIAEIVIMIMVKKIIREK